MKVRFGNGLNVECGENSRIKDGSQSFGLSYCRGHEPGKWNIHRMNIWEKNFGHIKIKMLI